MQIFLFIITASIINYFVKDYSIASINILALLFGFFAELLSKGNDKIFHPVIFFGKIIRFVDNNFNKSPNKFIKGTFFSVLLVSLTFYSFLLLSIIAYNNNLYFIFASVIVYYGVATKQLLVSVFNIFKVLNNNYAIISYQEENIRKARLLLSYIVSRDTSELSENQIKLSALESLSENLSDGIFAPIFYFALFGVPGIMAYKFINTLDSMIGYKNEKYLYFGKFAARLDDIVNFIPARLTALFITLCALSKKSIKFIIKYAHKNSSVNSGYPEAALAGAVDCRFGGYFNYFGQTVKKEYIGETDREISFDDGLFAINLCLYSSIFFVIFIVNLKLYLL
jgi:adenosylcobinamide-phosphate synthase